jgi:hypothetical protein
MRSALNWAALFMINAQLAEADMLRAMPDADELSRRSASK